MAFIWLAVLTILVASPSHVGLILSGVELALGPALIAALSPLIMLSAEEIRIWHGFRFINIGISEIAGVGLLYTHTAGYGGSWRLTIWRGDGSYEATDFARLLRRNAAAYDPVASSELPALNACRAATISRDIYKRVAAAQGPDGQLATRHLASTVPEMPGNEPVALRSAKRLGQHLVRDAIQGAS